ncbi:MAG: hypothetical protein ACT4O5_15740 [Gammaproteobacteria bacterium]
MALTHTFAVEANSSVSGTTLTTGTFDSTGFKHLVVFAKHEGAATTITASDNKSSTIGGLTKVNHGGGSLSSQLFHGAIGSPGAGHTVTMTLAAARTWRDVAVWLINNDAAAGVQLDVEAVGASGTSTAPDAGSIVATAAAIHIFGVGQAGSPGTQTPSAGWTKNSQVADNLKASRNEASAATTDPSSTSGASASWAAVAAAFRAATGGPPPGLGASKLPMMGVGR